MSVKYFEKISQEQLDELFMKDLKRRWISPEQWFTQNSKQMEEIYRPKNFEIGSTKYTTPSVEMMLLQENKSVLLENFHDRVLVFWGSGRKEAQIVNWLSQSNHPPKQLVIIDVLKTTIEQMVNLIDKSASKQIQITAMVSRFQDVSISELKNIINNLSIAHICLGTTIGNFDQDEIFKIFNKNSAPNDKLILGFQLNKNPHKILAEYRDDQNFTNAIKLPFFVELESTGVGKPYWSYNFDQSQVEYWFEFSENKTVEYLGDTFQFRKGEKIEIFRSKKYQFEELAATLKKFGFKRTTSFIKSDHALMILAKT